MDTEVWKIFGQVAGIGGLALGVFLILFKEIIQKNIFTNLSGVQSYKIIKLIIVLVWSIAIIGIGSWILIEYKNNKHSIAKYQKIMPFNTGWIFIGYFDSFKDIYIEGPYAKVVYRPSSGKRGLIVPEKGDILEITKPRRIIIANYKTDKLKNELISPPKISGIMSENDETGVTLQDGLFVLVRDITLTHFPNNPYAIWCRIVECDLYDDSCKKASAESI